MKFLRLDDINNNDVIKSKSCHGNNYDYAWNKFQRSAMVIMIMTSIAGCCGFNSYRALIRTTLTTSTTKVTTAKVTTSTTRLNMIMKASKQKKKKQSRSSLLSPPDDDDDKMSISRAGDGDIDKRDSSSTDTNSNTNTNINDTDEDMEEVYGAKFFGGSAIKEELFDEIAEENAERLDKLYPPKPKAKDKVSTGDGDDDETLSSSYHRFDDLNAFPDLDAKTFAIKLQKLVNDALYETENDYIDDHDDHDSSYTLNYSSSLQWDTPFTTTSTKNRNSFTPLHELTNAIDFYKRLDVAIIAANSIKQPSISSSSSSSSSSSTTFKTFHIRWEISLLWPNPWESRVLLTGTSVLKVKHLISNNNNNNNNIYTILSQKDTLDLGGKDGNDIFNAINHQISPRFWDLYHISMTPSAELMPRLTPPPNAQTSITSKLTNKYQIFQIPPRLVLRPSLLDIKSTRDDREAQAIPNHAFTSIIRTSGPKTQRYITTGPVEVSISRTTSHKNTSPADDASNPNLNKNTNTNRPSSSTISWNIPLPPEFVSYSNTLPLPNTKTDHDNDLGSITTNHKCNYEYQPTRLVATMKFGGNPQDEEVSKVRKELYELIIKEGRCKPKLDSTGRPCFFFLQNDAKACFTADGGLGMAVYDWRPQFAKCNEIGIELEIE
eukprot:CAMPEP_0184862506 /NCGR_PEP_ID=MMETSP0580-20130426/6962_1 /TAXON_ID=1118495 /ORGANISM="Dactyliosolen fragilissimus" /LENGTH=661 /DNA_ID=CAMNT_0027360409 /DNA_START=125 /DNA_END=2110 /DNA_ORIENTATION=+